MILKSSKFGSLGYCLGKKVKFCNLFSERSSLFESKKEYDGIFRLYRDKGLAYFGDLPKNMRIS